jgi:hypothetical protein
VSLSSETNKNPNHDLAKRFACAAISYQIGISYAHCWKQYDFEHLEIDDRWIELEEYFTKHIGFE